MRRLLLLLTVLPGSNFLPGGIPTMLAADPVIIAHRGASGYLPEHTLEAKAMAYAQGADFVEQDLVLTKDRVPVVLHDVQIDTVTDVAARFPDRKRADGRYYAIDLTLAELKTLNVHERTDPRTGKAVFPNRFPVGLGSFRVPTLEEEVDLVEGLNRSTGRKVGIYPELKSPAWHRREGVEIGPIVAAILKRRGLDDPAAPCFVQCFEFDQLRRLREGGHRGRLVYLTTGAPEPGGPDLATPEGWAEVRRVADGVGPNLAQVLRPGASGKLEPTGFAREAHAAGLLVHPWTIRADALPPGIASVDVLLAGLLAAGVDGFFIDQPDLGTAHLRARAARPAPGATPAASDRRAISPIGISKPSQ